MAWETLESFRTHVNSLWPNGDQSSVFRRELALLLLEDPDHRLRITHCDAIMRSRLPNAYNTANGINPIQATLLRDDPNRKLFHLEPPEANSPFDQEKLEHSIRIEESSALDWKNLILRLDTAELLSRRSSIGSSNRPLHQPGPIAAAAVAPQLYAHLNNHFHPGASSQNVPTVENPKPFRASDGIQYLIPSNPEVPADIVQQISDTWPLDSDSRQHAAAASAYLLATKCKGRSALALPITELGPWLLSLSLLDGKLGQSMRNLTVLDPSSWPEAQQEQQQQQTPWQPTERPSSSQWSGLVQFLKDLDGAVQILSEGDNQANILTAVLNQEFLYTRSRHDAPTALSPHIARWVILDQELQEIRQRLLEQQQQQQAHAAGAVSSSLQGATGQCSWPQLPQLSPASPGLPKFLFEYEAPLNGPALAPTRHNQQGGTGMISPALAPTRHNQQGGTGMISPAVHCSFPQKLPNVFKEDEGMVGHVAVTEAVAETRPRVCTTMSAFHEGPLNTDKSVLGSAFTRPAMEASLALHCSSGAQPNQDVPGLGKQPSLSASSFHAGSPPSFLGNPSSEQHLLTCTSFRASVMSDVAASSQEVPKEVASCWNGPPHSETSAAGHAATASPPQPGLPPSRPPPPGGNCTVSPVTALEVSSSMLGGSHCSSTCGTAVHDTLSWPSSSPDVDGSHSHNSFKEFAARVKGLESGRRDGSRASAPFVTVEEGCFSAHSPDTSSTSHWLRIPALSHNGSATASATQGAPLSQPHTAATHPSELISSTAGLQSADQNGHLLHYVGLSKSEGIHRYTPSSVSEMSEDGCGVHGPLDLETTIEAIISFEPPFGSSRQIEGTSSSSRQIEPQFSSSRQIEGTSSSSRQIEGTSVGSASSRLSPLGISPGTSAPSSKPSSEQPHPSSMPFTLASGIDGSAPSNSAATAKVSFAAAAAAAACGSNVASSSSSSLSLPLPGQQMLGGGFGLMNGNKHHTTHKSAAQNSVYQVNSLSVNGGSGEVAGRMNGGGGPPHFSSSSPSGPASRVITGWAAVAAREPGTAAAAAAAWRQQAAATASAAATAASSSRTPPPLNLSGGYPLNSASLLQTASSHVQPAASFSGFQGSSYPLPPLTSKAASALDLAPHFGRSSSNSSVKISARLQAQIVHLIRTVPGLKAEDFDEGVMFQLGLKGNEDEALAALRTLEGGDVSALQHPAAYLNHVIKNFHPTAAAASSAPSSAVSGASGSSVMHVLTPGGGGGMAVSGGGAETASSAPVRTNSTHMSAKAVLQRLPLRLYRRIEDIVNRCNHLEWKHFDAGVIKVLGQLAELSDDDVIEELEMLQSTDLSAVEYMPAYLNKRLNNRLWSKRKQQQLRLPLAGNNGAGNMSSRNGGS
ncbi:hypothetical protein CEUSTIGMA_g8022.t1 [Chlamydomonas eustigma]|uniref:Uncharacterized protein n=1 Tax=Chlamydomonas eustigma TaxID=1157962 RepID=A0A250XBX3_9CHLO|nr:hypothetical protein CEUSTIGMA_g8022.t1 [Chlamydomonas eustigma]|eukprot:GAX80585.1 hypothetical protein CEUSTIGMA_g8022.t1 [Chlamydomonas eustigma]